MQSQRLAKSVSQALIGSAAGLPRGAESSEVLARNVRGLKNGDGRSPPRRRRAGGARRRSMPLVDRAEKNAGVVLAQQKILTQVGQALRAINRQSSDLLETAETVSSLKLQQDVDPAEISALGQLVMLTQRIGKSANEFLTTEGVSPEAVFLLGKDLNSFHEIAQGLLDGSAELRLPGTRDPQTKERLTALLKQYEETAHAGRRHPGQPAGPGGRARGAGRDRRRQRTAAQGPGDGAGAARAASRGFGAPTIVLLICCSRLLAVAGGFGFLRLYVRDQAPARRAGREPAPRGRAPGAGSQARQRRQPGGHSATDERTADGGRRRPDAAGDGDRGHHRRHRRLGELHGGRAAHAGVAGAGHGGPGDRRRRSRSKPPRPSCWPRRPSSCARSATPASRCCRWPAESTTCRRRRRKRPRWRASRCRRPSRACRRCRTRSAA